MKKLDVLLCGVGGQGTVLASKLLAACAMERGRMVKTAETIGMAQRGGCVVSHVRVGADGENVDSPLIPVGEADILIGFEPGEAVRLLPYLKKGGTVVTSTKAVMPVTASLAGTRYEAQDMLAYLNAHADHVFAVDTDALCEKLGSTKVVNMVLLGAAAYSGALGFSAEELLKKLKQRLPEKFHALNEKALYIYEETRNGGNEQ